MRLALIPPNCMHQSILDGTINLILPWQLKELPTDFVQQALKTYTILDNGAAEGHLTSWNELTVLCQKYRPHEVVLPDALGDCETTREYVLQARPYIDALSDANSYTPSIMAVAQGQSLAEIMSCVNLYQELPYINVIGLPRSMNQQFMKHSRLRMCESLNDIDDYTKPIHCLGSYYYEPAEMRDLKWIPIVRSMDTSLPWVYGWQGRWVDTRITTKKIDRPEDYFHVEYDTGQRSISERNVNICLRWAQTPRR